MATDATKYLNKTEHERTLARISGEFDKVAYIGEKVGESDPVTPTREKKLSVSPRQSIIVGRAIPHHPRKGKKYYFGTNTIMVKGTNQQTKYYVHNTDGNLTYIGEWRYSPYDESAILSQYNSNVTRANKAFVDLYANKRYGRLVEITEECGPDATFDIGTMARIVKIEKVKFNSQTESPNFEVRRGRTILIEDPNLLCYSTTNTTNCYVFDDRGISFTRGKAIGYVLKEGWTSWSRASESPNYRGEIRSKTTKLWPCDKGQWKRVAIASVNVMVQEGVVGLYPRNSLLVNNRWFLLDEGYFWKYHCHPFYVFPFRRNRVGIHSMKTMIHKRPSYEGAQDDTWYSCVVYKSRY